jgi:hypothetical protein
MRAIFARRQCAGIGHWQRLSVRESVCHLRVTAGERARRLSIQRGTRPLRFEPRTPGRHGPGRDGRSDASSCVLPAPGSPLMERAALRLHEGTTVVRFPQPSEHARGCPGSRMSPRAPSATRRPPAPQGRTGTAARPGRTRPRAPADAPSQSARQPARPDDAAGREASRRDARSRATLPPHDRTSRANAALSRRSSRKDLRVQLAPRVTRESL